MLARYRLTCTQKAVVTSSRSWTYRAASVFYEWLVACEDLELPRITEICVKLLPEFIDPYRLAAAIEWLARQGMIDVVHGSRSRARGHYVIRVRSTGRVYRTADCPLELPPDRAAA
jgi:hypothetical protein